MPFPTGKEVETGSRPTNKKRTAGPPGLTLKESLILEGIASGVHSLEIYCEKEVSMAAIVTLGLDGSWRVNQLSRCKFLGICTDEAGFQFLHFRTSQPGRRPAKGCTKTPTRYTSASLCAGSRVAARGGTTAS
mmetsp:Transcript_3267/g.6522  ORF Transcript_3267/g.6522 Transcript_3267/m.6522 type:complete len:133 (-) Transcript_3267:534-932(-)